VTGNVGQEEFTMKSVKTLAMGAVVALSLVGASSASAANWDPQNTNVTASQEGTGTLTANAPVTCTSGHTTLRAVGAVATAITTTNPVAFTGCSAGFLGGPATVTTFGDWTFTATSTSNVTVRATSSTGPVAIIHLPQLACSITVPSPVHISNNTWSNTNHTLGINNAGTFGIVGHGNCGIAGTSASLDANFVAPTATIT
jgi:hypothetical protein